MVEQDLRSAELINVGVALALGVQLGFAGQLLSMLMAKGVLSKEEAIELLGKLADIVTASLGGPATDLQALTRKPLQDHAQALRKLAGEPILRAEQGIFWRIAQVHLSDVALIL